MIFCGFDFSLVATGGYPLYRAQNKIENKAQAGNNHHDANKSAKENRNIPGCIRVAARAKRADDGIINDLGDYTSIHERS